MENGRYDEVTSRAATTLPPKQAEEALSHGLDEALFKLLDFQAQQGADQHSTMIMLSLMNLLGIVNCMNRILPEEQRVRGTGELAGQLAGMLGGAAQPPGNVASGNKGGLDPALLAALASMVAPPTREHDGQGEPGGRPGIDPALIGALASMVGGPGSGGGANTAALMGMLANMMNQGPRRSPEANRQPEKQRKEERHEKNLPTEEKSKENIETKREQGPISRLLKWDPRFGSPSSSF